MLLLLLMPVAVRVLDSLAAPCLTAFWWKMWFWLAENRLRSRVVYVCPFYRIQYVICILCSHNLARDRKMVLLHGPEDIWGMWFDAARCYPFLPVKIRLPSLEAYPNNDSIRLLSHPRNTFWLIPIECLRPVYGWVPLSRAQHWCLHSQKNSYVRRELALPFGMCESWSLCGRPRDLKSDFLYFLDWNLYQLHLHQRILPSYFWGFQFFLWWYGQRFPSGEHPNCAQRTRISKGNQQEIEHFVSRPAPWRQQQQPQLQTAYFFRSQRSNPC